MKNQNSIKDDDISRSRMSNFESITCGKPFIDTLKNSHEIEIISTNFENINNTFKNDFNVENNKNLLYIDAFNICTNQDCSINQPDDDILNPMTQKVEENEKEKKEKIEKKEEKSLNQVKNKKIKFYIIKYISLQKKRKKHTKSYLDNGSSRIITKTMNILTGFFNGKIKNFRVNNITKYQSNIIVPCLPEPLKSAADKKKFLKTIIIKLYCDEKKRRLNEKKPKYSNKVIINEILEIENNNENIQIKEFNILFNASFDIYLDAFINNKTSIEIIPNTFKLDNFLTLDDCFNEESDFFNENQKDKLRNYVQKLIDGANN